MQRKFIHYTLLLFLPFMMLTGCEKGPYTVPEGITELKNDVIKRSLGPNLVGLNIEFAYAMAIPKSKGKLVSAQVEANIAGETGTYLENRSYYTDGSGNDIGVKVAEPSVNEGNVTKVTFNVDTNAATLRYYYVIPEAARGKSVSFSFSARSSDGAVVNYKMGPFVIAKMDYKLNLTLKDAQASYVSIADMAVYTAAEAATKPDRIDLVYLYRPLTTVAFNHTLAAPAADPVYLPGITLPMGVNRNVRLRKAFNLQDKQLADLQNGIYIDDMDFQQLNLADGANFAVNLKLDAGVWVETIDGKYRAYIYINKVDNTNKSMTISMKRYILN
jgi:hypothetical protein